MYIKSLVVRFSSEVHAPTLQRCTYGVPSNNEVSVSTSHIQSRVVNVRNKVQCGTWLVERHFSDKPKVVIRYLGLSYASLLVPVGRRSPRLRPPSQARELPRPSPSGTGRKHRVASKLVCQPLHWTIRGCMSVSLQFERSSISSVNDGIARATGVRIVGERASLCGYGADCTSALSWFWRSCARCRM